ncbi:MAG: universal stress protein, partial [Candidatus Omnitrophica bacterium]|nr:universal stress protein [Candidatus Omnitrophota bacterium]
NALIFALTILGGGLLLRWLAKIIVIPVPVPGIVPNSSVLTVSEAKEIAPLYTSTSLVALKQLNLHVLNDAALRAKMLGENAIYVSYVDEMPPSAEFLDEIEPSRDSLEVFAKAEQEMEKKGITVVPVWQIGENSGKMIARAARELGVNTVMIGTTRRGRLVNILRGDVLRTLVTHLPKECRLLISG